MQNGFALEQWGLHAATGGEIMIGNHGLVGLARRHGTPLHVVHARRLREAARAFKDSAGASYTGPSSVHYAMKCNSVPGIVEMIYSAGLNVEVTTAYELRLARHIGFAPEQIIVNGPGKTEAFLRACLAARVRLIIVDSLEELAMADAIAVSLGSTADILLRVNPGFVPRGMNRGTATASRTGCAFGLDLKGGEIAGAMALLPSHHHLRFQGYHMHIGTGIRTPDSYLGALGCLPVLDRLTRDAGLAIKILDVGGGFGSPTSRGMTTMEMALYETLGKLPTQRADDVMPPQEQFFKAISGKLLTWFRGRPLPELIFEPGRCIVSKNQFLLLTVNGIKRRPGIGMWATTDGGLSTVSMPTYYECHEVLLCNDIQRPTEETVTLNGPACFAGDILYKNITMPTLHVGDTLAVMDSGAYFTAMESSFGFPRPAIVAVDGADVHLIRTRETYEEMIARDILD